MDWTDITFGISGTSQKPTNSREGIKTFENTALTLYGTDSTRQGQKPTNSREGIKTQDTLNYPHRPIIIQVRNRPIPVRELRRSILCVAKASTPVASETDQFP